VSSVALVQSTLPPLESLPSSIQDAIRTTSFRCDWCQHGVSPNEGGRYAAFSEILSQDTWIAYQCCFACFHRHYWKALSDSLTDSE